MMKYFNLLLALCVLFSFSACKKKSTALENYDRGTLLKSLADNTIAPAYNNFSVQADSLYATAVLFAQTNALNDLAKVVTQWQHTVDAWQQCEPYNIGYVRDNSVGAQIASFPSNNLVIESEIAGTSTIDENYIAATGTTRKGLSAVEYLIFGTSGNTSAVQDSFANSLRRKAYLVALCAHIKTVAHSVKAEWNGGASYNYFTTQTQMDISGALNQFVNALVEHIEFVRKSKVGKPCGVEPGATADYSKLENRYAPRSLENIKHNIAAWRACFAISNATGINNYADAVDATYNGEKLSVVILNQLDACIAKANAINGSLESAAQNNVNTVKELHLELKKLTVLTKVDLSSSLGVVITFSDNDGD